MSSLTSLGVSLILIIFIYALPSVSSDCTTCCYSNIGCSTAYNGRPAKCCGSGFNRFCCPTTSTCGAYPYCNSYYYWGDLTLGGLIGTVIGSIFVCCCLIGLCTYFCRRPQQQPRLPMVFVPQSFHNPGAHLAPPPYPSYSKA